MAGTPPTTQVNQASGGGSQASPGYNWAQGFFNSLPSAMNQQYPSQYPGQLDPGLSPTMQNTIRMAQGYGQAPQSQALNAAQGTLGSFMSPNFINPQMRTQMGYPDYFGTNGGAQAYGGGSVSQLPGYNPVSPNPTPSGMQNQSMGMNSQMGQAGQAGQNMADAFQNPQYNPNGTGAGWGGPQQPSDSTMPAAAGGGQGGLQSWIQQIMSGQGGTPGGAAGGGAMTQPGQSLQSMDPSMQMSGMPPDSSMPGAAPGAPGATPGSSPLPQIGAGPTALASGAPGQNSFGGGPAPVPPPPGAPPVGTLPSQFQQDAGAHGMWRGAHRFAPRPSGQTPGIVPPLMNNRLPTAAPAPPPRLPPGLMG